MFNLIRVNGNVSRLQLEREILRLWAPILRGELPVFGEDQPTIAPRVNVVEAEKEYQVTAELPGVDEKDIQVNVTREGLSISGEKREAAEETGKRIYRLERSFGSFQRLVRLPDDIDRAKAQATFKKGVLKVILPKREDSAPKPLDIKPE